RAVIPPRRPFTRSPASVWSRRRCTCLCTPARRNARDPLLRTTVHINARLLNGGVSQPQPCDATNRLGRRMRGAGLPITPSPVGHGHIAPRPPGRVPVREARRQEATRTCL